MTTAGADVQITDLAVDDHACLTFGEPEDLFDLTAAFVRDGLAGGLKVVWDVRRPALIALGVGVLIAAVCWIAPAWVAAVIGGVSAAVTSAAVQAGLWVRRTLVSLALA